MGFGRGGTRKNWLERWGGLAEKNEGRGEIGLYSIMTYHNSQNSNNFLFIHKNVVVKRILN